MVGVHRSDDRRRRMQLQERAVELVGFGHHDRSVADQHVRAVVLRYASQEGRAAAAAFGEDMGYHGRSGGLPVRSGHREAAFAPGELAQHARTLDDLVAFLARVCKLSEFVGHGGSVDHERVLPVLWNPAVVVIVVDLNAFGFQPAGELRGGAVVAGDAAALELAEAGYRAHAYASYAYEVYVPVFHLAIL